MPKIQVCVLYGILTLVFGISQYAQKISFKKQELQVSMQDRAFNFKSSSRAFNFGQSRVISSLLWIHTLMESDQERRRVGTDSWMFLRFKTIHEIDPFFYSNYLFGGQYLSVVKDDPEGAKWIYEKGLAHYPDDFRLNFYAGFNDYFELGLKKDALLKYSKIENDPKIKQRAPYLPSMIAKIRAEEVGYQESFFSLLQIFQSTGEGKIKSKMEQTLYSLKAKIDLDCLNGRTKSRCDTVDFRGKNYIKNEQGLFQAQDFWSKPLIHLKN